VPVYSESDLSENQAVFHTQWAQTGKELACLVNKRAMISSQCTYRLVGGLWLAFLGAVVNGFLVDVERFYYNRSGCVFICTERVSWQWTM